LITERSQFTINRSRQLEKYPRLAELEIFGEYSYVPLAVPVYNYPEINQWFANHAVPNKKIKADIASPVIGVTNYDVVDVFPTGNTNKFDHWTTNPKQEFLTLFPFFMERVMEEFPFTVVPHIKLWSSNRPVRPHRDQTEFTDYPSSFRIMLFDNNPQQTLYTAEKLPDSKMNDRFFIPRLEETNSFVWNNLRTVHGSLYNPEFRKLVLIFDECGIDIKKYHDLLERSVSKYKQQALISQYKKSDYLDIV